jgi:alkylresorcinol/alkylpyrone synthase
MTIAGVASAFPKNYYPQGVLLHELRRVWGPQLDNPAVLDRLYSQIGVQGRYLALRIEEYEPLQSWEEANRHWIEISQELGEQALGCALKRARLQPTDIDALFFVSITGISSPSIDARLINRMGLSTSLKRIPIFGLGCVAGAAGIARAADYVRGFPNHVAAVLAVELCSLTLQQSDLSMANLISAGLFGDGAGAVLVAGADRKLPGPRILDTRSTLYPNTESVMGWDISEKGFKIVLSRDVPMVIEQNLAADANAFLSANGLTRQDVQSWILHTGGPSVLEATQRALNLPAGALDVSWACLRRMGNLSSASVLLVLEEVMLHHRPAPGTYSILAAMGPGFCSELVLLRW